ncbi:MAG: hydrogenase iron-sulfur subunit [Nitrospiria bacterium]
MLTLAEITKLAGRAGNFTVAIREQTRFVTDQCTRCDDCVPVCPQTAPNPIDANMATRKAIDTPFDQAEPGAYWVDLDLCLNDPPNLLPCDRCVRACEPDCIDFSMPLQKTHQRRVRAVILATGFSLLDPQLLPEFGYGSHPDVLTSMEFERLMNATGPTEGEILRPSNRKKPHNLLFVLCIGSRDRRACAYCSGICCMYSIKEALRAVDHGVPEVTLLYMDIRAYGKGFDDFYRQTSEQGVRFVHGRPSRVRPEDDRIAVTYEDTRREERATESYDMVVLAPAIIPSDGTAGLAKTLGVETDANGFIKTDSTNGIQTSRRGVYAAGCVSGPRDIPDSVSQGSAAAAQALTFIRKRTWPPPPDLRPCEDGAPRIGVFLCHCGINVAGIVDMEELLKFTRDLPDVGHVQTQLFSCSGAGASAISDIILAKKLNRLVVAACSPKTHGPTFMRACENAGLNPWLMTMANIRNHNSWVHRDDPVAATEKAKEQVAMAAGKARLLKPLETRSEPLTKAALVIGGGVAGMTAAINLAHQGFPAHLVERRKELGGLVRSLDRLHPSGESAATLVKRLTEEVKRSGVQAHTGVEVEMIDGYVGNFRVRLSNATEIEVGAMILATGAHAYEPEEFGCGKNGHVITNLQLEERLDEIMDSRVTFVACVGARNAERGCSRYCCQAMLGQALRLQERGNQVRVLYKDIRTYGRGGEELYERAARAGVRFFRYDPERTPREVLEMKNGEILMHDLLSDRDLRIPTDLLVLTVGLVPTDQEVARQLAVSRSEDGFLLEKHPKLGPAEAAMKGIYMAGTAQAPKTVDESIEQALAAASKASDLLSKETVAQEPLAAILLKEDCIGCLRCVKICPYNAIEEFGVKEPVNIIQALCMGCGACDAECPTDAIEMPYFTTDQIKAQIDAALAAAPAETAIVFVCNWCSYGGADQAGVSKYQYPTSCRLIRTMCSARVDLDHIQYAFDKGTGMVYVTGCHIGDCHYNYANKATEKRFASWRKKLERKEIDPERLQLAWVSAAEGQRFAEKMKEADTLLHKVELINKDL